MVKKSWKYKDMRETKSNFETKEHMAFRFEVQFDFKNINRSNKIT